MQLKDFPADISPRLLPQPSGELLYRCLGCGHLHGIEQLLYTCPLCGSVLLIEDTGFERLKKTDGPTWRRIFDHRAMLNEPALAGVFRFAELIAPIIPLDSVIYLGEGHTPQVRANTPLRDAIGADFCFKNDGQNPSASFKDRGMAAALSYINYLTKHQGLGRVLSVCASTGDTSAAAALYGAYLQPQVASAVLLPRGKVTPQQLSQPLGAGGTVMELPGVFDDCMKVVEYLAERYQVALLNSKNAWRILGQESFSYEVAQQRDYDLAGTNVFLPIGNAGNISAVMAGFLKLLDLGIITELPRVIGVQSAHSDPVFRYYQESDPAKRVWRPITVQPSVAQAAMIGDPVSMPRVVALAQRYDQAAGKPQVYVVQVSEQEIMDHFLLANRHGHVVCTQGGESLAGLSQALRQGLVGKGELSILDATAHHLKFIGFQQMYFEDSFPPEYEVSPRPELVNLPQEVEALPADELPAPGKPLQGKALERFVAATAREIARRLQLKER